MRFEGRRVIVTGGARGIGRGIVDAFLDEGRLVLATDVLGDGLAAVRARASARGSAFGACRRPGRGRIRSARWCRPRSTRSEASTSWSTTRARNRMDRSSDVTPQDVDACFAVNVRAPLLLMQDVCRHLIDRGAPGSIVNIASANAFQNESPESIYNASKAALVAVTKALAHEMGHHGIRANCVAPGETITPEAEEEMAADPRRTRDGSPLPLEDPASLTREHLAIRRWRCSSSRVTTPGSSPPRPWWWTAVRSAEAVGTTRPTLPRCRPRIGR